MIGGAEGGVTPPGTVDVGKWCSCQHLSANSHPKVESPNPAILQGLAAMRISNDKSSWLCYTKVTVADTGCFARFVRNAKPKLFIHDVTSFYQRFYTKCHGLSIKQTEMTHKSFNLLVTKRCYTHILDCFSLLFASFRVLSVFPIFRIANTFLVTAKLQFVCLHYISQLNLRQFFDAKKFFVVGDWWYHNDKVFKQHGIFDNSNKAERIVNRLVIKVEIKAGRIGTKSRFLCFLVSIMIAIFMIG